MSREKPKSKYIAKVVKYSNGARLPCFKEFIGRNAEIRILKEDKNETKRN